jgi:chromosome segregation ATPase
MLKEKLPLIVLLALLLISGFITFKFYADRQKLAKSNEQLKQQTVQLNRQKEQLSSQNKDLQSRNQRIQQELDQLKQDLSQARKEKDDFQQRYNSVAEERARLAKRIRELIESGGVVVGSQQQSQSQQQDTSSGGSKPQDTPDYWADFVQNKAKIEAKLEEFRDELIKTKKEISEYKQQNRELSLKLDELEKEKGEIERQLAFKQRTMEIMSRDLVNERERAKELHEDVKQLREENMELKRELILADKKKIDLQDRLIDARQKEENLEKKVSQVKSILKDKDLLFSKLEGEISSAVDAESSKQQELEGGSTSVELPPIVVKSDSGAAASEGSILAINRNDNFIIIDLGRNSGVEPGMQLEVIRGNTVVAEAEIIETREEISAADITNVVSGYSLRKGDAIQFK